MNALQQSVEAGPFTDPRLDHIYRYWLAKRDGRAMPQRADIRPSELGPAIRLLNLVDVMRGPLRFRHRLVGSEHVEWLGRNVTGRILDESLYGEASAEILHAFATIVRERRPYFRLSRLDWNNQKWLMMEAVELPLADAEGEVGMLLRGAVFRAAKLGQRPVFMPLA